MLILIISSIKIGGCHACILKFRSGSKSILDEVHHELKNIYDNHLQEIILFGSYLWGDYSDELDLNLILLVDQLNDPTQEWDKYEATISRISIKYHTMISIIPFEFDEFYRRQTPFDLNVNREGIAM